MTDDEQETPTTNTPIQTDTPSGTDPQPRHADSSGTTGDATEQAATEKQPETLDELKASNPGFADLPELRPPQELGPVTAAKIMACHAQILEGLSSLTERAKDGDPANLDQVDWSAYSLFVIEACEDVLPALAVDRDAWDGWTKGRNPYNLMDLFFLLVNLYAGQLGKSDGSATSTDAAR